MKSRRYVFCVCGVDNRRCEGVCRDERDRRGMKKACPAVSWGTFMEGVDKMPKRKET